MKKITCLLFISLIIFSANKGVSQEQPSARGTAGSLSDRQAAETEETSYQFGTFFIPKMVEDENKGIFIDLLREIEKRTEKKFTVHLWPVKRTFKYFRENKIAGFFPAAEPFSQTEVLKPVTSDVFYMKREFVFTRERDVFGNVKDLEGKRVGLTFGYTYSAELLSNPNIRFDYSKDDITNMKKLAMSRTDAFIVEEFSGLTALKLSGVKNIRYDPAAPFYERKVCFAFQQTESGIFLAKVFSDAIKEMKRDGTLKSLLGVSEEWIKMLPEK
ncbi:MAG: hypothetical protein BWK80_04900 [Desulfobacteraceae bacterium IS3]|nr:MAG: hypothetical protein BWK80_04900 [Desulfobacteraceae bacterium IS3]